MRESFRPEYSVSPADAAQIFGVTPQAIYQRIKNGKLGGKDGRGYRIASPDIRKLFEERGLKYNHQVISFQCCKGGVGKTSLAYSLAIRANMYGARVLCIDLDMQGHLTLGFTTEDNSSYLVSSNVPVWSDLLKEDVSSAAELIVKVTPTLHLIPSNLENSTMEAVLANNRKINIRRAVAAYLEPLKDLYDYIIIDCAPGFSGINTAATCASDLVLIPAAPDRYGVDGVEKTIEELAEIKSSYELSLDTKIILNRYDARKKLSVSQLVKLQTQFSSNLLACYIRENSEIPNATAAGLSVFEMPKKKTTAKEDLDVLTREILGLRN
jgi:chromosome partitioning protein